MTRPHDTPAVSPVDQLIEPDDRYMSRHELRALFPVSDMTIWRWQRDPQIGFPAPVKLSPNGRNFWWLPAIRDWERRRRDASAASRQDAS